MPVSGISVKLYNGRMSDGGSLGMEKRVIMCEVCRNNCRMEAETEDKEVIDVTGNGCMKGYIFAQNAVRDDAQD